MVRNILIIIIGVILASLLTTTYSTYKSGEVQGIALFIGALLASAIYIGILFVTTILPMFAEKFSRNILSEDSGEYEDDGLHDARAALAQGDYDAALLAYRKVVTENPGHRLAWTDMAKLYAGKMDNQMLSITTLKEALESYDWPATDQAEITLMLANQMLEQDDAEMRDAAIGFYRQIRENHPDTRYSGEATTKLYANNAL